MALNVTDIRSHQIWLTRKANVRKYAVTRQFYNEHVYAAASLTSVNQYDSHQSLAGFVQSVSDSGVERFGYKALLTGGRYNGVAGYEASVLSRQNVTSLTFEVTGNGGTAAQFMFFIFNRGMRGSGERSFESDWSAQSYRAVLGFDAASNELSEVHEFYGDDKFLASEAEKWLEAPRTDGPKLRFIAADAGFRFDPDADYVLSESGVIRSDEEKPRSTK